MDTEFLIDPDPIVDRIQFNFKYANSVLIHIEESTYRLLPAQTSNGCDTLWVINNDNLIVENTRPVSTVEIDEIIHSAITEKNVDGWNYKITLKEETFYWSFFAAEFYENNEGAMDFKINDEMIFGFGSKKDSMEFEKILKEHTQNLSSILR